MRGVKLTGHNARNYHGERVFVRVQRFARFWRFTSAIEPTAKGRPTAMEYQLRDKWARQEALRRQGLVALRNGYRVAVVFDTPKGEALPASWNGFPVIDADETDLRFLDAGAVVAGLRAKGTARHDASGFVVHAA